MAPCTALEEVVSVLVHVTKLLRQLCDIRQGFLSAIAQQTKTLLDLAAKGCQVWVAFLVCTAADKALLLVLLRRIVETVQCYWSVLQQTKTLVLD